MKKNAPEKNPARAVDELILLAAVLAALALAQSGLEFHQKARTDPARERFAAADENGETFLLALSRGKTARQVDRACPELELSELDALKISGSRCGLFPGAASNFARLAAGKKVDLNRAAAQELMLVSGIGQKRAEELLRLKDEQDGFKNLDELRKLDWINDRMLLELGRYFAIGDGG